MANSFRFPLQSIVRLRERDRDQAAEELRLALQAKQVLLDQITEIEQERDQLIADRVVTKVGVFDPQRLVEAHRYQMQLEGQITHLQEQVSLIEQECQRRRFKLVKCEQAVRSLEKLKEKQHADWEVDQVNKSQDTLDQWSSFRYWSVQD
jgi:flagellar protein FliJ